MGQHQCLAQVVQCSALKAQSHNLSHDAVASYVYRGTVQRVSLNSWLQSYGVEGLRLMSCSRTDDHDMLVGDLLM